MRTADRLGGQLVRVFKLFERARAHHMPSRGDGVEPAAYRLLAALVVNGPQRSGALAHLVHSDPSTVSRQIAALVRFGHARRVADPGDGRAALVTATPQGRETFAEHRARRNDYLASITARWSAEEVETLTRLLSRFAADIEALDPDLRGPGPGPGPGPGEDESADPGHRAGTDHDIPAQTKDSLA